LLTIIARLAAEFAGLVAMEQVGEAVRVLRDEEGDVLEVVGELDAPVHAELLGDGREGGAEGGLVEAGRVGGELDAHEEEAELDVLVLVGVEDVDVVLLTRKLTMVTTMPLRSGQSMSRMAVLGLGMANGSIQAAKSDYLIGSIRDSLLRGARRVVVRDRNRNRDVAVEDVGHRQLEI
jgi:hypothetical protein